MLAPIKNVNQYNTAPSKTIVRAVKTEKLAYTIVLIIISFTAFGCPKAEVPFGYDLKIDNKTNHTLKIVLFNSINETIEFNLDPLKINNSFYTISLYKNEINKFLVDWSNGTQLIRNDIMLMEWNGPAYLEGVENHFNNINAWTIQDINSFNSIDGVFAFTTYQ